MKNADAPPVHQHVGHAEYQDRPPLGHGFLPPRFPRRDRRDAGAGRAIPERGGELLRTSRVFHAVTPGHAHLMHLFLRVQLADREGLEFMKDYLRPVIEEDKFATEEIEKMLAIVGESPPELLIKSDRNAVEARRMLQAMMDDENAEAVTA